MSGEEWPYVITSGPWPERIGSRCRIVTEEMSPHIYPRHGLGAWEEIVRIIEDDPLASSFTTRTRMARGWSCALDAKHLSAAPVSAGTPEATK